MGIFGQIILVIVVLPLFYAPLYVPLIASAIPARHKSWEFACAQGIAWLATVTTRTIALHQWHPVNGDAAQSFRDAGINIYWTWTPAIVAHIACSIVAAIFLIVRKCIKKPEQGVPPLRRTRCAEGER